jgi:D-glycero-alpha-D-manno-heptose-7-phosphate kinase
VFKVAASLETIEKLERSIILCYTGISRNARDILAEVNTKDQLSITERMSTLADYGQTFLEEGNVKEFGELLRTAWSLKRKLSDKISSSEIDALYERALQLGAWGGKVLGAGGGGYLMVMADPEDHAAIINGMSPRHCYHVKLVDRGTELVYNNTHE